MPDVGDLAVDDELEICTVPSPGGPRELPEGLNTEGVIFEARVSPGSFLYLYIFYIFFKCFYICFLYFLYSFCVHF